MWCEEEEAGAEQNSVCLSVACKCSGAEEGERDRKKKESEQVSERERESEEEQQLKPEICCGSTWPSLSPQEV